VRASRVEKGVDGSTKGRLRGVLVLHLASRRLCWTMAPEVRPLFSELRAAIRTRHYSPRTEEAYVHWVRRFVRFAGTRHPRLLGVTDVTRFLSSLAVEARVSASTQNQALSALVFLYKDVLDMPVGWLSALVRAKRPARVPVVFTKDEVRRVLARLRGRGTPALVAGLLYGTGARLLEVLACGSRMSTSRRTRSSCVEAKAIAIAGPCCRSGSRGRC
jgi:site-specific recombinase XerD